MMKWWTKAKRKNGFTIKINRNSLFFIIHCLLKYATSKKCCQGKSPLPLSLPLNTQSILKEVMYEGDFQNRKLVGLIDNIFVCLLNQNHNHSLIRICN